MIRRALLFLGMCAVALWTSTACAQSIDPVARGLAAKALSQGTAPNYINLSGLSDFAVGPNSGNLTMTGTGNVIFGIQAGSALTVPAAAANPQGDTLIGYQAGNAMTSGRESVCVGYQACLLLTGDGSGVEDGLNVGLGSFTLSHATTAHANTAVGQKALLDVSTGQYNIGIGPHAGASLSTGQDNIMIGHASGNQSGADSTGSGNIGIGSLAFAGSGSYSQNIGIGGGALAALTNANDNVAIGGNSGGSAGGSLTTGTRDVFVGTSTGTLAVIANDLTCIGYFACKVATGSSSTYVGSGAGQAVTTGQSNTVVGFSALGADVSGGNNTAIGRQAGKLVTGGSNTIIGTQVGSTTLTSGSGNILVGTSSSVDTLAAASANYINIGGALIGYATSPTVTSGLGTSPTVGGAGTFAFPITVGATGTPTTAEVLAMPTAPTGWICQAQDQTTNITARQSGNTTTSVTFTWSVAPTASDVLLHACRAY